MLRLRRGTRETGILGETGPWRLLGPEARGKPVHRRNIKIIRTLTIQIQHKKKDLYALLVFSMWKPPCQREPRPSSKVTILTEFPWRHRHSGSPGTAQAPQKFPSLGKIGMLMSQSLIQQREPAQSLRGYHINSNETWPKFEDNVWHEMVALKLHRFWTRFVCP